ncbi:MAG: hypothetical protein HY261_10605, partial [Chloroflexi bacterium]|nr:hypothetical protein [Chloroflexota bacterium]
MTQPIPHKQAWETMRNVPHLKPVREGDIEPGQWLTAEPGDGSGLYLKLGIKAQPSRRGMTLMDLIAAGDESPPAEGYDTVQIRGAGMDPKLPINKAHQSANKQYLVWADNIMSLYEEAISRQWSATRDIPWERLQPLPPELEKALCHIASFLTRVEFGAADRLGPWLIQIGYAY